MPLNKIKHTITEIDGVRCSVVELCVSEERVAFIKTLLEHNKFDVKVAEIRKADEPKTFMVGVTDIKFNILFSVYDRSLRSLDNYKITPAFWLQQTTIFDPRYWLMRKRIKKTA